MEITLGHINVNNICAKISIEYGNEICNEFSWQGPKIQELCPKMNQISLWKRSCKQHTKKYLTLIIQNKIEDKIQGAGERAKEISSPNSQLLHHQWILVLNCHTPSCY